MEEAKISGHGQSVGTGYAMKFRIGLHNPLDSSDPSDGFWDDAAECYVPQFRVPEFRAPSPQTVPAPPPIILPAESLEAQAAQSSGSGSPGSVVAETSGGLTINLLFDAAAMAAPASFRAGIQQAAALLSAAISDKITLNFQIDYSGTGGGAAAGPDNGQWLSYSSVRADLINNATAGDTTLSALPAGSTIQGQSNVAVWNAQLKLWGLLGANDTTTDDGGATFATDINPNLLLGVALHELTHAMGRVPYGSQPDIFDFYRFTSAGVRSFSNGNNAPAAYFSLDGGSTKLADYGQTSDPSDFLNNGVQGSNDPFDEFYSGSTLQQLTAIDLKQLDALGFHLTSTTPVVIQTDRTTSLVQIGSNYFLDPVGGGTGPELKFGGNVVMAGQFGGWTPIGAVQTASGYDVAWKDQGTNEYSVWHTDSNGNYISDFGLLSGNSNTLESLETVFNQDLNSDGVIGVPSAASPAMTQAAAAPSGQSTFDGTTLTLGQPSTFTGQIVGFTGDGTRAGSDQIDLRDLNYNSVHFNFDSSSGTFSLNDGSTAASLQFLGQYSQGGFHFADDSNGGTLIIAATPPGQNAGSANISNFATHDTFVFAPNFGQISLASFAPATDTIQFSKNEFADVTALLAATHDDASGNAVITDAALDTITLQHVTTAQLLAHQNDFHFV
jgi:hypothetical protein